jgi:hypothetical protein
MPIDLDEILANGGESRMDSLRAALEDMKDKLSPVDRPTIVSMMTLAKSLDEDKAEGKAAQGALETAWRHGMNELKRSAGLLGKPQGAVGDDSLPPTMWEGEWK